MNELLAEREQAMREVVYERVVKMFNKLNEVEEFTERQIIMKITGKLRFTGYESITSFIVKSLLVTAKLVLSDEESEIAKLVTKIAKLNKEIIKLNE